jgi:SynChlorMet cassette protein ScmC
MPQGTPPIMNHHRARVALYHLVLADGSRWEIAAGDEKAASAVSKLAGVMRLRPTPGENRLFHHDRLCRLLVQVGGRPSRTDDFVPSTSINDGISVVRILNSPADQKGVDYLNLVKLSLVLAREAQAHGGVLIHGALAERDGFGVIMAASSGTGKTTASHRLPAPWRSLCDDTTLMVRDAEGDYWAHPWPTWSRLVEDGAGGRTWDVQSAVPVKGIFVLARAVEDRAERVGPGHAVSLLMDCVGQASSLMDSSLGPEALRALRLERFDNLCALARAVPAYWLHLSLTGSFWQDIEQALKIDFNEREHVFPLGGAR